MDDSDSSSLSSALPSDDERLAPIFLKAKGKQSKKLGSSPATTASPPRPKRAPSPPHEEVLADNPDIAFIVIFRSRFSAAFPPKLAHFGPQDIERGVVDSTPSPLVDNILCALLGLVLNRKKPVERGHHGRALEEAIASHKSQWPRSWEGVNPLRGSNTFNSMGPAERLNLLRTLIIWSLNSSEGISTTIKDSYKQSRHEDDLNQPLSVQPWGMDSDKRRYWLVEGQDDTNFRLYREGNRTLKGVPWRSMAGTIDEIKEKATALEQDSSQASRRLATKIFSAIPRFEATEEKRKRREYRQVRRAQFVRPEPGFSLYEGRTRGKRMRYTYDDDADDSDELSIRRSTRNSDRSTPAEAQGPVVTASGRQVRARGGGMYGESLLSGQATNADTPVSNDFDGSETSEAPRNGASRATRSGGGRLGQLNGNRKRRYTDGYNDADRMSDEDDATSSGNEWDGGEGDDDVDDNMPDADEDGESVISDEEMDELAEPDSLVVKLKIGRHPELPSNHDDEAQNQDTGVKIENEAPQKIQPVPESSSDPLQGPSTTQYPHAHPQINHPKIEPAEPPSTPAVPMDSAVPTAPTAKEPFPPAQLHAHPVLNGYVDHAPTQPAFPAQTNGTS